MTALAIPLPPKSRVQQFPRSLPDLPGEPAVTITVNVAGGPDGRGRVLAALQRLVDVVGADAVVEYGAAAGPGAAAEIVLDPRARTAVRAGRRLDLSRLEYDLLIFLVRHPRQVFSRIQLLTQVWGHRHTTNRTVDVHVSRLRAKLNGADPIATVYGLGYRLADDAPIVVLDRATIPAGGGAAGPWPTE